MTSIESASAAKPEAWFKLDREGRKLAMGGAWTIAESARLDRELAGLELGGRGDVTIDASKISRLDSAGAWLLLRTRRALEAAGAKVSSFSLPELYQPLLKNLDQEREVEHIRSRIPPGFRGRLYRIGRAVVHAYGQTVSMLGYLGRVTVETGEAVASPRHKFRIAAMFHQVEETGINALPIVGLLAFLIGVVLAYQGADQLKRFGAEIFTINLLGVGVLREIGGLITAIIVAGRSGSAFTAQIGTMRVNEEIDAMQTMGLNTIDTLVLPRIVGLVIALPLLTFYADIMGLLGGAMMCYFQLGITIPVFLRQLNEAITTNTVMVGLIKAPVFAFVIALVGCYEGFQVERNAASVGLLTTRSVVEGIFLVIVLDAAFSVMFSVLGI
ncbi:MAG TPA: MlaE family lipid ABC transporter permease subunit [Rhizomicrobium sp.]|jgi:phospholipid/cholesterol/gamma-HCH transport system permease protein|nr:MlaE family lipid ABC transporter permease subunit [Rhizomicrobium sp.]